MAAYILVEIEVTNPEEYARYREMAPALIAAFDGKYLTRGGATETVEGTWQPKRLVILEFPSMERIHEFYDSPAYAEAKLLRQNSTKSTMVFQDGI
ncbi:MAG TPA: DUF1330 domain-containing protein [Chloroflexota bacterium]|nr:DUF1330 domain-containing protein [Chloroflexota bacterium]